MVPTSGFQYRRSSRKSRKSQLDQSFQYKIVNTLKTQKCLPAFIQQQFQKIEYLSEKSINSINYNCENSQFDISENLIKMKQAASKQQQRIRDMTILKQNVSHDVTYHNYFDVDERQMIKKAQELVSLDRVQYHDQMNYHHNIQDNDGMDLENQQFNIFNDNYEYNSSFFNSGCSNQYRGQYDAFY